MTKTVTFLAALLFAQAASTVEPCGRTAVVNYQEVLVDASSSNQGEGLRYYLQKDPVSKRLLDEYQENNRPRWQGAALSTLGTAMVIGSFLRANDGEGDTLTGRNTLLYGGITMIAVSYLISRTQQHNNEELLQRSVEEYNKRNSPRIYFSADPSNGRTGYGMGVQQEF